MRMVSTFTLYNLYLGEVFLDVNALLVYLRVDGKNSFDPTLG